MGEEKVIEKQQDPDSRDQMPLEEMFEKLEGIVKHMETDNLSLEDSFSAYHEGMLLLKQCGERIDAVEKKVQVLDQEGGLHDF